MYGVLNIFLFQNSGQKAGITILGSHSGVIVAVDTYELKRLIPKCEQSIQVDNKHGVLWSRCLPGRIESDAVVNSDGSYVYVGKHLLRTNIL